MIGYQQAGRAAKNKYGFQRLILPETVDSVHRGATKEPLWAELIVQEILHLSPQGLPKKQ